MTLALPDWNFTTCNQSTVEIFKVRDENDFITRAPWTLSPEKQPDGQDSANMAKSMIETAMREGSHFFEWTHSRADGETFAAEVLLTRLEYGGRAFLQATVRNITARKQAEEALQKARDEVQTLQGILPICSNCKKIRDDKGHWNQVEVYVRDHTEADFSHGICPECAKKLYPDIDLGCLK